MVKGLLMCVVALALCMVVAADTLGPPVELLEGLASGKIKARFWGGGDRGVNGIIERGEDGPSEVIIAPGTQFWAQALGGGLGSSRLGQFGGGRQGQAGLGSTGASLRGQRFTQVWIPTACTNIGLPAPTEQDVMIPMPSPSGDMTRLCRSLVLDKAPQPVVQVAVWAVANDPPPYRIASYVREQSQLSGGRLTPQGIMEWAARLLLGAGLDPANYRMFW